MKTALLQINPTGNVDENLQKAKAAIEEAARNGADIALLPELWNIGYVAPEDYRGGEDAWQKAVMSQHDEQFNRYAEIALSNQIAIALGYLERDEDELFDAAALIDIKGELVQNYRKVHTVRKNWEIMLSSGEAFYVTDLKTKNDIVKVGLMICYDREFPEAARLLMHKGAEIILVPNASAMEMNRLAQLKARGYENMVGIATTNYPQSEAFNGRSSAFDGMREKGIEYDSTIIVADESEGIFYADFDLPKLREYRQREIWGDAYRKPWLYSELLDEAKSAPFIRDNFQGRE
jgi:predicted amidohydrolase